MLKIIMSFDDGRKDNYRVAKDVLEPLGIPATFNVTTGYIKNDIDEKDKPGPHSPMTIDELKELSSNDLFEIAGHGVTHDNEIHNLLNSVIELRDICGDGKKICGIASPHSEFDLKQFEEAKELFMSNGICYLRISNDYSKMSRIKIWVRRFNRILHSGSLYYWVNNDSIMDNPSELLFSIPVIRDNRLHEVKSFVEKALKRRENGICILMFHSILFPEDKYYNDLFSWDFCDFRLLCEFFDKLREKKKVDIVTTSSLYEI